jgi:hypothetical protein
MFCWRDLTSLAGDPRRCTPCGPAMAKWIEHISPAAKPRIMLLLFVLRTSFSFFLTNLTIVGPTRVTLRERFDSNFVRKRPSQANPEADLCAADLGEYLSQKSDGEVQEAWALFHNTHLRYIFLAYHIPTPPISDTLANWAQNAALSEYHLGLLDMKKKTFDLTSKANLSLLLLLLLLYVLLLVYNYWCCMSDCCIFYKRSTRVYVL